MQYFVYIMCNIRRTVLYVGRTTNLNRRIIEHKTKAFNTSFTANYNVDQLVYYEVHNNLQKAARREKQLKRWRREWKEQLIKESNPEFKDLTCNDGIPDQVGELSPLIS